MEPLVYLGAAVAVGSVAIAYVRRRGSGGGLRSETLAHVGAWLLAGALAGVILWAIYGLAEDAPYPSSPALAGALVGLVVLLALRGSSWLALALYRWAMARPLEHAAARLGLRSILVNSLGFAAIGAGVGYATARLPPAGDLLLLPAMVALVPLFESTIRPWITMWREPGLEDGGLPELGRWVEDTGRRHGLPRIRVRVLQGGLINAYVLGGLFGHWLIVGGGLLQRMDPAHLRAILAHELAHLVRRDTGRYLAVAVVAATLYALALPTVYGFWNDGRLVAGSVLAAAAGAVCFALLPGLVSRRTELGADRLAVEMLGEAEILAEALEQLASLKGHPLDRESVTHPSYARRLDELRHL